MSLNHFKNLPLDIIIYILTFDDTVCYRNGTFINRINKNDYRKTLLLKNIKPIIPCGILYFGGEKERIRPSFYRRQLCDKFYIVMLPNYRENSFTIKFLRIDGSGTRYLNVIK